MDVVDVGVVEVEGRAGTWTSSWKETGWIEANEEWSSSSSNSFWLLAAGPVDMLYHTAGTAPQLSVCNQDAERVARSPEPHKVLHEKIVDLFGGMGHVNASAAILEIGLSLQKQRRRSKN
jgi:hypothetical protein